MQSVIDEFAELMNSDDATSFRTWGNKWAEKWQSDQFFLAPELRFRPWMDFVSFMQSLSADKTWAIKAMQLWNTKYASKLF